MLSQPDSIHANLVLSELVRSSRSLTIWIQGGQAPISIWPAIDLYLGTLVIGSIITAGFRVGRNSTSEKNIWVNIATISRIDADPLPARETVASQPVTPSAPAQVG